MIPSPFVALVLGLAALRISRLIGWDTFPPIVKARDWATGAHVARSSVSEVVAGHPETYWAYRHQLLRDFIICPYCAGWWICLLTYVAWVLEPRVTLYVAVPLALSSFVGLVAKTLDP